MNRVFLFLVLISIVSCKSIAGKLLEVSDFSSFRIYLHGGKHLKECLPNISGKFNFHDIDVGTYSLEIVSSVYAYPHIKIKVDEQGGMSAFATTFNGTVSSLTFPLSILPEGRISYFEFRKPFDAWSYLKSPYVILIGLSIIMMMMMRNVDPKEMEEAQRVLNSTITGVASNSSSSTNSIQSPADSNSNVSSTSTRPVKKRK